MDTSDNADPKPTAATASGCRSNEPWSAELIEIYRSHYQRFVCLARRIVCDQSLAEDCVQDAFMAFHTKGVVPQVGSEIAYLRSMVRNGAISRVRRDTRSRSLAHGERLGSIGSAEETALSNLSCADLLGIVAELSGRQGEVVRLSLIGMNINQTAVELAISAGTVKTHRHRAVATLRTSLARLAA